MSILKANLQTGDCLLTASKTWLSKAIKFFGSNAKVSHTAGALDSTYCIEAVGRTKISHMKKYDKKNQKVKVYRLPLSADQKAEFFAKLVLLAEICFGIFH